MKLINQINYPQLRYESLSNNDCIERGLRGERLPVGQYTFAVPRDGLVYLGRDPLGCNKLFFGYDRDGNLVVANCITRVWRCGVPVKGIASCPPGHLLAVSGRSVRKAGGADIFNLAADGGFDIAEFQSATREVLDDGFAWIAREFEGAQFVVCLSGGLDSGIVASFAAAHLPGAMAASFTYLDSDDLRRHASGSPVEDLTSASEDFHCAAKMALALRMKLLPVVRSREAVESAVEPSVRYCQDWRDFNVHCATVNLFLAEDIRRAFPNRRIVALTGDLMNEYLCDYRDERVGDTVYYRVPNVPLDHRRKYFVRGLDAGDREIGVFWSQGVTACQPYSLLAERYMRVPGVILSQPDVKWNLNGPLLAPEVREHVGRVKRRAQVGGNDLGTLGIYHRLGIGEEQLRRVWRDQFPGESPTSCDALIQFGRYKVPRYASEG